MEKGNNAQEKEQTEWTNKANKRLANLKRKRIDKVKGMAKQNRQTKEHK